MNMPRKSSPSSNSTKGSVESQLYSNYEILKRRLRKYCVIKGWITNYLSIGIHSSNNGYVLYQTNPLTPKPIKFSRGSKSLEELIQFMDKKINEANKVGRYAKQQAIKQSNENKQNH